MHFIAASSLQGLQFDRFDVNTCQHMDELHTFEDWAEITETFNKPKFQHFYERGLH